LDNLSRENGDRKGESFNSPLQVVRLATAAGTGTTTAARLAAAPLATTGARSGFASTLIAARLTALFAFFVVFIFVLVLIRHFFLLDRLPLGTVFTVSFYLGGKPMFLNRFSEVAVVSFQNFFKRHPPLLRMEWPDQH
jgi:hypothetical protein